MSKKQYKVSEVVKLFEDDDDEAFRILKQDYSSSEASSSESEGISENDSNGTFSSDEDSLSCTCDTPDKPTKTLRKRLLHKIKNQTQQEKIQSCLFQFTQDQSAMNL